LRRLRRALRAPVHLARPPRRAAQRRRPLLDPPSRHRPHVLQEGLRRRGRVRALARGERGDQARARGRDASFGHARLSPTPRMRVAYLGPPGTFSQEALLGAPGADAWEAVPQPSVYDTVLAVHEGRADRALVPIENSLEGSVNATLDALAFETDDVAIVGELVHPVSHCLIARDAVAP